MWLIDRVEKKGPYKKEFYVSQEKFLKLKAGYYFKGNFIVLNNIVDNLKNNWLEPEWGFPKGRRNPKEKDADCANRELCEEMTKKMIIYFTEILNRLKKFASSSNILYKHVYFWTINSSNKVIVDKQIDTKQ